MTTLAAVNTVVDPQRLLRRVARNALDLVPHADGALVGLSDAGGIVYVCGAGRLEPFAGTSVGLHTSFAGLAARTGRVLRMGDAEREDRADRDTCRRLGVVSLACIPLVRGGETLGVIAMGSASRDAFDDQDVLVLEEVAEFVALVVGLARDLSRVTRDMLHLHAPPDSGRSPPDPARPQSTQRFVMGILEPGSELLADAKGRVQEVLDHPERLSVVFQPVVDLGSGQVVGAEALSRFAAKPLRPPDEWFADAEQCGLGVELELLALRRALSARPRLPAGVTLGVNVGPAALVSEKLQLEVAGTPPGGIVLELTEHSRVENYEKLLETVGALRERGFRFAVDDTGAGFSGLAHILRVAPDFIKLDRDLVSGIDLDPVRRSLAAALVAFAEETGASIVAEGVERASELDALSRLGVHLAQGFFLGRPGPVEELCRLAGCRRDLGAGVALSPGRSPAGRSR